jgi:asparagine synthase (glutamine-hydrolysing)
MCGIAGCWTPGGCNGPAAEAAVRDMALAVRHRGPDDMGTWCDGDAGIAFGHRRLSILDLSPLGHQPMLSANGRWVLAFNGEIYNCAELRTPLERAGVRFRGHSDTEILLEGIACWGLEATLQRAVGMFAIAAWNRESRTLHLARDRFGEKPLYYGWMGGTFLFASELKSMRVHPAWRGNVDRGALALYLRHNCVPAPFSIYEGIRKLLPGHVATLGGPGEPAIAPYWSLEDAVAAGARDPLQGSDDELVALTEERLRRTIAEQMVADVPLGALLSGGIDSTLVVALMQAQSARSIRTFTIGFHEAGFNEAEHAMAVARHLGTEHTELYVTPQQALDVIPRLPTLYDEPFGDSSQVPTFLVAQLARQHVTVALSGDGGDEMFGGYSRYFLGERIWRRMSGVPRALRQAGAAAIRSLPPPAWQRVFDVVQSAIPPRHRVPHAGDRMHKLAGVFQAESGLEMYRLLVSHWHQPDALVVDGTEPESRHAVVARRLAGATLIERMMFTDAQTYLPDDIMVKVDRATMAVSLESRAPFLDHRVAGLAWRLPLAVKVRDGVGKWVLREVLHRHVPRELVERPKMGFGVPIDRWLRGPLREWAAALLAPERLRREGFLRPGPVTDKWVEHQSGRRNWQYHLWDVLMFQAWLEAEDAGGRVAPAASVAA